jgi:sec-independent protein translocase protein TatB
MFGIDSGELLVIALVALVVIGPKDLPRVMRVVGRWVGQARGMARQFRSGFDTMIRESEIAEMEEKWREDNERIMRMHPPAPPPADGEWGDSDWGHGDGGKPVADAPKGKHESAPPHDEPVPAMKPPPAPPAARPGARRAPPVPRRAAPPVPGRKP